MRRNRLVIGNILLFVVLASVWLALNAYEIRMTNLAPADGLLQDWATPQGERALVIAPHCDDETLGCAQAIRSVLRRGGHVKVVLMTNGDGFYTAAARSFRGLVVSPERYVEFGMQRQRESLRALRILGVKRRDVIFLGYPDRGLAKMWLYYWSPSKLCTSAYTKDQYSPYPNAYRPNAPYCGSSVLEDLKSIISDYKPTTIYYPHSSDQHPDHWATYCYVVQTLQELGMRRSVRSGLYIVHRGDWPVPQGLHKDLGLAPPAGLRGIGTRWSVLRLSGGDVATKQRAVNAYRTQVAVMRRFMSSFIRKNEVFGSLASERLQQMMTIDIFRDDTQWDKVLVEMFDPSGDGLNVDVRRDGDIRRVQICRDTNFLYARVELARPFSRRLTYGLRVHGIPSSSAHSVNILLKRGSKVLGGGQAAGHKCYVDFRVPLSALGKWNAVMVSADSFMGKYQVDRTGWRLITD